VRAAQAGNARMPVWLCKQLLGHKDTSKVEQTGPDGAAIKHGVHVMLSESEREQLKASWDCDSVRSGRWVGRRFASIAAECVKCWDYGSQKTVRTPPCAV
jgi:hypothetical protein